MIQKTNILDIEYNSKRAWLIDPPQGRGNNGYASIFPQWWSFFDLKGIGYTIGEDQGQGNFIRRKLKNQFPKVIDIHSVSLKDADYNLDIVNEKLPHQVNFIFCMAVLEHVIDVGAAIRNMSTALTTDGLLFISVPGQKFKQHRYPIDCYRFLEDALVAFAEIGKTTLADYTKCGSEWCAVYRKLQRK